MPSSFELRWFHPGALPDSLKDWIAAWTHQPQPERRTDVYCMGGGADLTARLSAASVEIALRQSDEGSLARAPLDGRVERWVKWTFPIDATAAQPDVTRPGAIWVDVATTRWRRKFSVDATKAVTEIPPANAAALGVNADVSELRINGTYWWTVGLETFGSDNAQSDALSAVVTNLATEPKCPACKPEDSMGYPAWIHVATGSTGRKRLPRQYVVGDIGRSGAKVSYILGSSRSVIVYKDDKGTIQWEAGNDDELSPAQVLANQTYDQLAGRMRACMPESEGLWSYTNKLLMRIGLVTNHTARRQRFTDDLALALFTALNETEDARIVRAFEAVSGEIAQAAQNQARVVYVRKGSLAAFFIIAAALGVIWWTVDVTVSTIAMGALAGGLGAWTSIVQRASRLELGKWETPAALGLQSIIRVPLGAVFGVLAIAALKAKFLFANAADDPWIVFIVAVVAGISERLIPDLITKLENGETKQSEVTVVAGAEAKSGT